MATSKKKPPRIRARTRGSTMQMLESTAQPYREAHPDKEVRWVYAPEHNKAVSQIYKRQAEGYTLVDPTEEDLDYPHGVTGSTVRVADLVLMSIDKDKKADREAQLQDLAEREGNKSRDSYLEAMRRVNAGGHSGVGLGDVKSSIEEVEVKLPTEE